MSNILSIKELSKTIGKEEILNDINLEIDKVGIYGIVGRNGSGKSILFKIISGIMIATSGDVEVFGKKIGRDYFPVNFGALLDYPGFLGGYSGFYNLKILASIQNKIEDNKIYETLEKVGLEPKSRKKVKNYSLGMRQRLGIAQAIMENPKFIVLDEPMNGLDEDGVFDIRNLLIHLKNKGVTILLSSHNREDIEILCDRVYRIKKGILQEEI